MLPKIYGLRTSKDSKGALGVLFDGDKKEFAVFAEGVSATGEHVIPVGISLCKPRRYEHGGYNTFEIIVLGHSAVLFHKGNFKRNSIACICVAEAFNVIGGEQGVSDSEHGFNEFWEKYKEFSQFELDMREFSL